MQHAPERGPFMAHRVKVKAHAPSASVVAAPAHAPAARAPRALPAPARRVLRALFMAAALVLAPVLALFAPQGVSLAQGVSLRVTSAAPIQVIENAPLVVGKATAIRVSITAGARTRARLEVALGPSRKVSTVSLAAGANSLYVPVDPPGAPGPTPYSARVSTTAGAGGNQLSGSIDAVALARNRISVALLPVDWSDQDRARYFPARYTTFSRDSGDFFKASFPFPEGGVQIAQSTNNFMLSAEERAIVDSTGNVNWDNITAMYSAIELAGKRVQPDADLTVGVLPPKWYARNLNDPNVVGLEFHVVPGAVSSQVDSDYATLAHEAGHTFGRVDDYDFSIKPVRIGNRIDLPGYWYSKGKGISPGSRPVTYSFMGASDKSSQYWVDRETYMSLLAALQSGVSP